VLFSRHNINSRLLIICHKKNLILLILIRHSLLEALTFHLLPLLKHTVVLKIGTNINGPPSRIAELKSTTYR
jgi:hypothetical protein